MNGKLYGSTSRQNTSTDQLYGSGNTPTALLQLFREQHAVPEALTGDGTLNYL